MRKIIKFIINPPVHIRKIYLRILSGMTAALVFMCIIGVGMQEDIIAKADTASTWTKLTEPAWKSSGYTSLAEMQAADNLGYFPLLKNLNYYVDGESWTYSYPKLYQVYGYTSESDYENAINQGVKCTVSGSNSKQDLWLAQCAEGEVDPELAITSDVTAVLDGVKFSNGQSLSDFASDYLKEVSSELDDVDSQLSEALSGEFNKSSTEILSEINSGQMDWDEVLLECKDGLYQLNAEAQSSLQNFIAMYAGKEISQLVTTPVTTESSFGSTFNVLNGSYSNLPVYIQTTDYPIKANNLYDINLTSDYLPTSFWTVIDFVSFGNCSTDYSFMNGVTENLVINTNTAIPTITINGVDQVNTAVEYYPCNITVTCYNNIGKTVNLSTSLSNVVSTDIADATGVTAGAPSQNPTYQNTYQPDGVTPSYAVDPSKSSDPTDLVGKGAFDIGSIEAIPVVVTPSTSTSTSTSSGTSSGTGSTPILPITDGSQPTASLNFTPLEKPLMTKFPFCIPWDLIGGLQTLVAPQQAPSFSVTFPSAMLAGGAAETKTISPMTDMGDWSSAITVLRFFLSIAWTYFLILKTRTLIRG